MSEATPSTGLTDQTVTLETPIKRGEETIASVYLRKPNSGELRGLSLQSLGQSDVNSLLTLLPRITVPPLTAHEVETMEIEDLSSMASVVFDFFMSRETRARVQEILGV